MKASSGTVEGMWEPFKPQHQLFFYLYPRLKGELVDDEMCPKAADVIFHLLLSFLPPLSLVQGNDSLFSTRFQNESPPVMPWDRPFPGSGCYINSVTGWSYLSGKNMWATPMKTSRNFKSAVALATKCDWISCNKTATAIFYLKKKILRTLPFSWPCVCVWGQTTGATTRPS